jgi:hypothetical protein
MLTALLANLVATAWSKHAFYDHLKNQYIHEILKEEPTASPEPEEKVKDPFLEKE